MHCDAVILAFLSQTSECDSAWSVHKGRVHAPSFRYCSMPSSPSPLHKGTTQWDIMGLFCIRTLHHLSDFTVYRTSLSHNGKGFEENALQPL